MREALFSAINRVRRLTKRRKPKPLSAAPEMRFDISAHPNTIWAMADHGRRVTVRHHPIIKSDTKIFAMGSCFAVEIRAALRALGHDAYPRYHALEFDPERQQPGPLWVEDKTLRGRPPAVEGLNHYDTFVIRQEIERALAGMRWSETDMWRINCSGIPQPKWRTHCRDPYRRTTTARDMDSLMELSGRISDCIDQGLAAADVVILTLGLTEVWRNRANGLYVCQGPRNLSDPIVPLVEFHSSTFQENYDNLIATVDALRGAGKHVVLTVSPVPMGKTWTAQDVVVANTTSKTILRAVTAQVLRERPDIDYWPAFELTFCRDIFGSSSHHPRQDVVRSIISSFIKAHNAERSLRLEDLLQVANV